MNCSASVVSLILLPLFVYGLVGNTAKFLKTLVGLAAVFVLSATSSRLASMARTKWKRVINPGYWKKPNLNRKPKTRERELERIESFTLPASSQPQCPLFSTIPAEVRDMIYDYVFADYEDLEHPYDMDTCYRRPGYFGPRRSDTALLRTCQAVYHEAWFMPWTKAQHTFYFATDDRSPKRITTFDKVEKSLAIIHRLHPDMSPKRKETGDVQIFAQLYQIERTGSLQQCLHIPNFFPKSVTVTIRHTDCWNWEVDHHLHIDATWIRETIIPAHIKSFRIQLESLKRKKVQVDWMTEHMIKRWYLKRDDGTVLIPKQAAENQLWTGSSTWNEQRWVRDEDDNMPDVLEFYLATVTFVPAKQEDSPQHHLPKQPDLRVPRDTPRPILSRIPFLCTWQLHESGVAPGTPASAAVRAIRVPNASARPTR